MDIVTSCAHEGGSPCCQTFSLHFRNFCLCSLLGLAASVTWQVTNERQGLASRKPVWRTTPDLKSCLDSLQDPPSSFHIYNLDIARGVVPLKSSCLACMHEALDSIPIRETERGLLPVLKEVGGLA